MATSLSWVEYSAEGVKGILSTLAIMHKETVSGQKRDGEVKKLRD